MTVWSFRTKSDCFSVIRRKMSTALFFIKEIAVNFQGAGRFTVMKKKQLKNLQSTKNAPTSIAPNGRRERQFKSLLLQFNLIMKEGDIVSKIAVVYWSGTGNTEAMAASVAEGAREQGAEVSLFSASEFDTSSVSEYDALAFGCPAMGAEVLEESEFEPMFNACESSLNGKKIVLFGSYGWGDGEWMRSWEDTCKSDGAIFAADSVICNDAPDDEAEENCKKLGVALAK